MHWKTLKTKMQYQRAVKRTLNIFHAKEGTAEADELALLLALIKDYENKHISIPNADLSR
jgi:HTH-type transcriptional regulator/antitoxin HigA